MDPIKNQRTRSPFQSKRLMYRDIPKNLLGLIEPVVVDHGLELVDAQAQQGQGRAHLRVIVDTPEGDGQVTLQACAEVSREIEHGLDARDFFAQGSYLLEVCSPGVDRTLGREKDFVRVVGRRVALETLEPLEGRRRFRGELVAFDGDAAHVHTETGDFRIPFSAIARAQAFHPSPAQGAKR